MNKTRAAVNSWLWLLALTFIAVGLGNLYSEQYSSKALFICLVMLIVVLKGQQIIDVFMELKHAPKNWRYLFLSYIIIVPSVITIIYLANIN